ALTAAEADVALAREALDVHDAAQRDEVLPVGRLESHDSVAAAGESPLELVRGGDGHQSAHELAAVEGDLEPNLGLMHRRPPRRGRRGWRRDGRMRPRARRGPGAARRRSTRRL